MQETIEILRKEWSFLNDGIQSAGTITIHLFFPQLEIMPQNSKNCILRSVDENSSSINFHSDIRSKDC